MRKTRFLPSCGAAVDTVPSKCPVRLWMKGPMMDVIPNPTPKQEPEPGRVGVFIDGGCLDHLNGNLALHTPRRKLSLAGLADYAERALGGVCSERHYVRGRVSDRSSLDKELADTGFTRHDTPVKWGREIGADITLALTAYACARDRRLSAVLLLTADGDMTPLVASLAGLGCRVMVPYIHMEDRLNTQRGGPFKTNNLLLGGDGVENPDLFVAADQSMLDPQALPLLTFLGGVPAGMRTAGKRRRGRICHLDPRGGHILIEESNGARWYAPAAPYPGEKREVELKVGAAVEFSGAPYAKPGARHPRAYSLTGSSA